MKKLLKSTTEYVSTFNRRVSPSTVPHISRCVDQLKKRGFVMLDHLVGTPEFEAIKAQVDRKIEKDFELQFPCLSQSKIDVDRDRDLIETNFLATNEQLSQRGLTFDRDDVTDYQQMVTDFTPSTLTVPMPSEEEFYNLWLDPVVTSVVSSYMGFVPNLTEAYIRRNFPSIFRVMNFNWHRDTNHDKYLVKVFIFFTDCDIFTGAHHYIAGSANDSRFRDKLYFTDDEINSVWPIGSDDHMISTVPAGTIIIEDTRGLHKAGIPKRDYRDLGFAVFTPPNFFIKSQPYLKINGSTYKSLSKSQQVFIDKQNLL